MAAISKEENKATVELRSAKGMHVFGLDNSNSEARKIVKEYEELLKDNAQHYESCKAELLVKALLSKNVV